MNCVKGLFTYLILVARQSGREGRINQCTAVIQGLSRNEADMSASGARMLTDERLVEEDCKRHPDADVALEKGITVEI
jgi:hypothetical protein